jgi:pyrroloquinoline quinone (PQQ) biosynthesis protein C
MRDDTGTVESRTAPAGSGERREIGEAVASGVEGRSLLSHPFYRRWEAGRLAPRELAEYAVHYRAFEAALPLVLQAVSDALGEQEQYEAAALVGRNLADETSRPEPHLVLFDRFAAGMGADTSRGPGPAATALVGTYRELVDEGPAAALAGLAAYETQAAAVAATKADGLRRLYTADDAACEFWDVHASMDADHGDWAVDALTACGAPPAGVFDASRRAADAWWAFLDEREDEAPVSAGLRPDH